MPRGSNLTPDHQRRAAQAAAKQMTPAFHAAGGRARAAAMTRAERSAAGVRGAAVTAERYGWDFLMSKLAAWRAARPPTSCEAALLAALTGLGLVERRDFWREYPAEACDAGGADHIYVLDVACFTPTAQLAFEADGAYWHDQPSRALLDTHKDAALQAAGWTVIRLPEALLADPAATRRAVYRALLAAGGLGELQEEAA